jgi:N-acetylglucosaminyldiphosphoundecaprenol N-acetyl-beta-D-mannosaminyltransferase
MNTGGNMFTKILGYKVFSESKIELMNYLKKFKKINIISGNPEVLYRGLEDRMLFEFYTDSDSIIIPDGIGTVIASRLVNNLVKEKIAGIEVMEEIIKNCVKEEKAIYLVGAQEEVLKECTINLISKYPNLSILGSHNGYFDLDNCSELIDDIKVKKPYALFVAMGSPRQETFIHNYFHELPCEIFMGVGGSFDVFAGHVKRAPKWMVSIGLEWLYRVIKEPFRIKRLVYIPKFLLKVFLKTRKK